jgi:histidine triad (HIT) family protein
MHVMPRIDGVALLPAASRKEDIKVLEDHATRLIAALASS